MKVDYQRVVQYAEQKGIDFKTAAKQLGLTESEAKDLEAIGGDPGKNEDGVTLSTRVNVEDPKEESESDLLKYGLFNQIKDSDFTKGLVKYLPVIVPAGAGAGNVPYIVKEFMKMGGKDFTIEPHLSVFDGLKDLENDEVEKSVSAYVFPSKEAAFDAAVNAFKTIIQ